VALFITVDYGQDSRQPREMKSFRTLISLGVVLGLPILGIMMVFNMAF